MREQEPEKSTSWNCRWIAMLVFGTALGLFVLSETGCDDEARKNRAADAEARAAQAEQAATIERSKREQAELSARRAEDGRAFWLAAAAIGTVAALVIGTAMGSKARTDLQKQQQETDGQQPATERTQEMV